MEMSPESSPGTSSKRSRAKPKIVVKSSAASAAEVPAKKPRVPRKTLSTKAAATEAAVASAVEPSSEAVDGMIATAAYYLAAARNFTPGHELDDWLEAERSVRAQLWA